MKAELINTVENALKTNLFNGLLAKPFLDLEADMREMQKLVSFIKEHQNWLSCFYFTESNDLDVRTTETFIDREYQIDWTGRIDEKKRKADIKKEDQRIAVLKKACDKLNFNKGALENIAEFIKPFDTEYHRYFRYKYTSDSYNKNIGDIRIDEIEDALKFLPGKISELKKDYSHKKNLVELLAKAATKYLNAESLNESDTVIINVGERDFYDNGGRYQVRIIDTFKAFNHGKVYKYEHKADTKGLKSFFVDAFIFTDKHFIKITSGEGGLIDKSEHLYRDFKKVNLAGDEILEIYFHGHYDPATIILDSYEEAMGLQRKLTRLIILRRYYLCTPFTYCI